MRRMMGKIFAEDVDDFRDVRMMTRHDHKGMGDEDTPIRTEKYLELRASSGGL